MTVVTEIRSPLFRSLKSFKIDTITGETSRKKFSDLLDRSFQVPQGRRFFDDFPIWDETIVPSGEKITRIGVFSDSGCLVASAGVRIASLLPCEPRGGDGAPRPLPVALIGAVATDEDYRGHGLASELVTVATQWASTRGAAAAFLWGSEHALYRRLGFELCGTQVLTALNTLSFDTEGSFDLHEGWTPALMELLMKRQGGLRLNPEDFRWFAAHRGVRWVWTSSPAEPGVPKAYAAIGRGIDLTAIIHEWGGEKSALFSLLTSLRKTDSASQPLQILASPAIFSNYGINIRAVAPEMLCLAKVLSPSAVIQWVKPASETAISPEKNGSEEGFRMGGASGIWLSDLSWSRVLFGSPLEGKALKIMPQILPVPLWIWGLDAV